MRKLITRFVMTGLPDSGAVSGVATAKRRDRRS